MPVPCLADGKVEFWKEDKMKKELRILLSFEAYSLEAFIRKSRKVTDGLDDFFSYFVYDTELILLLRLQKL
jgi:hypothetical protein